MLNLTYILHQRTIEVQMPALPRWQYQDGVGCVFFHHCGGGQLRGFANLHILLRVFPHGTLEGMLAQTG